MISNGTNGGGAPQLLPHDPNHARTAPTFWEVARRRIIFLLIGTVVGGGVGYLYASRKAPIYSASSRVLVLRRQSTLPLEVVAALSNASSPMDEMLQTHMELIRSPLILDQAVKDPRLPALPTFAGKSNIGSAIMAGLTVQRPRGKENTVVPNVIEVSFRCEEPHDPQIIVQAIVQAYEDYVKATETATNEKILQEYDVLNNTLSKEIEEKEKEQQALRAKSPLFFHGVRGETISVEHEQLLKIEQERQQLEMTIAETQSRIKALLEVAKNPSATTAEYRNALAIVIGRLNESSKPVVADMQLANQQQMLGLRIQENKLLEKYGADHPEVKSVRNTIKMVEDWQKNVESRVESEKKQQMQERQSAPDLVKAYIRSLEIELNIAQERYKGLKLLSEEKRKMAKATADELLADEGREKVLKRKRDLYDATFKRANDMKLANPNTGTTTQVIAKAAAQVDTGGELYRAGAFGGILGLMFGFGLAYLVELADKCFRSPEEIRMTLGVPVMAHIPEIAGADKKSRKDDGKGMHRSLVALHSPKSSTSEAFRSVRTALYFSSAQNEGIKVVQITSPEPSDGKTTLACNVAVTVAQSGKRVLLIDADLRRPRVHKLFGLSNDVGVSTYINDNRPLIELVQTIEREPNLSILSSGERPSNPAELLTSARFEQLLEEAKQHFDFVLVDTPPVLAVTDPATVAPRVDGVIVALRLHKNARPQAKRAIETLAALNSKIIGIVVNGIPTGGGYGGYGYGGYGYAFNYRYGNGQYGSYNEYSNYEEYFRTDDARIARR